MAKDYAKKYTKFNYQTPRRKKNRYLWVMMLGFAISLFILGLFFLKPVNKPDAMQQAAAKLKRKILEAPVPKSSEPKFDFYNILSQDSLNLSPQALSPVPAETLPTANEMPPSINTSPAQKPLDTVLSATPEQVAIAEAKKQLEQEIGQLTGDIYILVLGNFTDPVQAEQLQAQALLKGFPVEKKKNLVNGRPIYQIFIGPSAINKLTDEQKRLSTAGLAAVMTKINP